MNLRYLILTFCFIFSGSLSASMINLGNGVSGTFDDVNNKLTSAWGINIGDTLYDVSFMDGTCIDLYNGCDSPEDFLFQTSFAANQASNALFAQVFIDLPSLPTFDSTPSLTFGCENLTSCLISTPYGIDNSDVLTYFSQNTSVTNAGFSSSIFTRSYDSTGNTGDPAASVYAVWSLSPTSTVPNTGTFFLFGLGLVVLRWFHNRSNSIKHC